jgi:hypothetical protein
MEVLVRGPRDVRGTLDGSDDGDGSGCVVACPPHPKHRGSRSDERLRAVADALVDRDVDCLRIDYGPWARGDGEVRDAVAAVRHAREELGYDRVALFGYSFGGCVALLAAADLAAADPADDPRSGSDADTRTTDQSAVGDTVTAVSVLAPAHRLSAELDAVAAVESLAGPLQAVYGARDTTVDWGPVVDAIRQQGGDVVELPADHFFVGQAGAVADEVAPFLARALA